MPIEAWFPTFVYFEDVELSDAIKEGALEAVREQIDPETMANHTGITASCARNDFHQDPRIAALLDELHPVFRRCFVDEMQIDPSQVRCSIGRCWPVVQISNGSSGIKHHHRGATFSAVLYLRVPEGAGNLEFYKDSRFLSDALPKTELNLLSFQTARYSAKENRILIFPSELEHRRSSNTEGSEGERLAIAFDFYASSEISHFEAGIPHSDYHKNLNL
ncbi:MAG: putative 2OG-Fe(II) oxygenase [Verrucomicrobiales bacterium]|nr:putative 2OG-Fe(II) oxygenase [Verrucomicrobiales bacterium]